MRHESKCRNLHGHRYVVEVTCSSARLDDLGRVIDFGVVKSVFGSWIDDKLDHGTIVNGEDAQLLAVCLANDWKLYVLPSGTNPTAEHLAQELLKVARELLDPHGVHVDHIRVFETPNCWADACD